MLDGSRSSDLPLGSPSDSLRRPPSSVGCSESTASTTPTQPFDTIRREPLGLRDPLHGPARQSISDRSSIFIRTCAGCQEPIYDWSSAFEINVANKCHIMVGKCFHSQCFRCHTCKLLFDNNNPWIPFNNEVYCETHYHQVQPNSCYSCKLNIADNPAHALGKLWHREHLQCEVCQIPVPDEHYELQGKVYCASDYDRITADRCKKCTEIIYGEIAYAMGSKFHLRCFVCNACQLPFRGQKYFVWNSEPHCKSCYYRAIGCICSKCEKPIEDTCVEIPKLSKLYHTHCFTCDTCHIPLSGGYYSFNGKSYCDRDIQEAYLRAKRGCSEPILKKLSLDQERRHLRSSTPNPGFY
ncbi:uncharacterized protein BJ171DRAFT_422116 [Polychytrium aggregatum]|uniref:uncharacterized protein n=1 Tax=Polychytrium aggregatum TaxID=110093 RepID=UPI0022FED538|nr:uncharacterized protein BJ171DRAFT_422116 [Polychytrium aggregatum]KAI9206429.1 hypothetical protein BJ171DRAFT_422116 [Polychytrium aggregatum]